jgi:hypothetical protein
MLQRTVGNRAVSALLSADRSAAGARLQRMGLMAAKGYVSTLGGDYLRRYGVWLAGQADSGAALEPLDEEGLKRELDEIGPLTAEEAERREFRLKYRASPVLPTLLEGLDTGSPDAKLLRLLENFTRVSFNYTMASNTFDGFLRGRADGDCNTLVITFFKIATIVLGIPVTMKASRDRGFDASSRFITPAGETIGVKRKGNVDNGAFWHFDNHFWIEHEGKEYDVLFGRVGVDSSKWVKRTGAADNPSVYEHPSFNLGPLAPKDGQIKLWPVPGADIPNRYTTVPPKET